MLILSKKHYNNNFYVQKSNPKIPLPFEGLSSRVTNGTLRSKDCQICVLQRSWRTYCPILTDISTAMKGMSKFMWCFCTEVIVHRLCIVLWFGSSAPGQIDHHFADDIFKSIFLLKFRFKFYWKLYDRTGNRCVTLFLYLFAYLEYLSKGN